MTDSVETADWIAFDDVEIDVAGRRLRVAGAEAPLEPKAFAVLLLLVRRAGRVVARDEILDAVWGHRHVTPGVLNRVVTLLRQALGETAHESQYLSTLHGVGYRFDARLRFSPQRPFADAAGRTPSSPVAESDAARAPPPAAATSPDADAVVPVDTGSTTARKPSPAPADAATGARSSSPASVSRKNNARMAFAAIAALLLIAAIAGLLWPRKAAPPSKPAATPPALVVLPLRPIGTGHDEAILAEGLSEELITHLSHVDGLRLISSTSAMLAQSSKYDPQQLADRLNVSHALDGSLRQSGDKLRIDLRLIEVPSGRTLWAQNYDRSLVDRFALESEIAQAVASAMALRFGIVAAHPTTSVDANPSLLRAVLEARTISRDPISFPDKNPEAMMRSLIAEHPDYAPAHASLALNLTLRSLATDERRLVEAQREAALAMKLDPNLPETYMALARCAGQAADWDRAIAMYEKTLELVPTDTVFRTMYGMALAGLGYLDQGMRQAEIGVASDPLSYISALGQVRMLDTLGRHDDAKRHIDAFGTSLTTAPRNAYVRWFNAFWRHDRAGMRAALESIPLDDIWVESYAGVMAAIDDTRLWPAAEATIAADEQHARAGRPGAGNFLWLVVPKPDYDKAFAAFDGALRSNFPTYYLMVWMPEYREARQSPAFQDFLKRNRILDYWRTHGFPPQCRAEGDGARCD